MADILVYHYASTPKMNSEIRSKGILSPANLIDSPWFKEVIFNYKSRIKEVFFGKITPEVVLDFLDLSKADVSDDFYSGRRLIYALLNPVSKGVSKQHDRIAKSDYFSINLTALLKDEPRTKVYLVELPIGKETAPTNLKQIYQLQNYNMLELWNKDDSEGYTYGKVPHIVILTPSGKIAKKYLSFVQP